MNFFTNPRESIKTQYSPIRDTFPATFFQKKTKYFYQKSQLLFSILNIRVGIFRYFYYVRLFHRYFLPSSPFIPKKTPPLPPSLPFFLIEISKTFTIWWWALSMHAILHRLIESVRCISRRDAIWMKISLNILNTESKGVGGCWFVKRVYYNLFWVGCVYRVYVKKWGFLDSFIAFSGPCKIARPRSWQFRGIFFFFKYNSPATNIPKTHFKLTYLSASQSTHKTSKGQPKSFFFNVCMIYT